MTAEGTGTNLEGCTTCEGNEHGCCPDGLTPAEGAYNLGCECAGSKHGCCPDGVSEATDSALPEEVDAVAVGADNATSEASNFDFSGCGDVPGEVCFMEKDPGTCKENFTEKWFYDKAYGGCSRFWWSGCGGGNENRYDDSDTCRDKCVKPPGSGRCYLPKATGPCRSLLPMWYFDRQEHQCKKFTYGGCLGNENRFESTEKCALSCLASESEALDVCSQPMEPGPCRGSFQRFYYDAEEGECKEFMFGGCKGNKNRFSNMEQCANTCRHKAVLAKSEIRCHLPKIAGVCNDRLARWHFDHRSRSCQPFYYTGCHGNDNRFDSLQECEVTCPNVFPPVVKLTPTGLVKVEEGADVAFNVSVDANPPATIIWQRDGQECNDSREMISKQDQR